MNLASLFLAFLPLVSPVALQETTPRPQAESATLEAARGELAEIRVQIGARRDPAAARVRLEALAARLAPSTAAGAAELRAEIARLTLEVRRALGDPALAADDTVDAAIREAIRTGDEAFLYSMGLRAVPSLVEAVRRSPDAYVSDATEDPLYWLLRIDAAAAGALLDELREHPGFLWRKRAVRVLNPSDVWNSRAWPAGLPPSKLDTGFARQAERCVDDADPAIAGTAMNLLFQMARAGERSPELERAMLRDLHGPDGQSRAAAKNMASSLLGVKELTAMLEDQDTDLRAWAAERLVGSHQEESRAILAHADDPSPLVRISVASWFLVRGRGADSWGSEGIAALERLVLDEDERIRKKAMDAFEKLPTEKHEIVVEGTRFSRYEFAFPLPETLYRSLVGHGHEEEAVEVILMLPAPLCLELAAEIVRTGDDRARSMLALSASALPFFQEPVATLALVDSLLETASVEGRNRLELVIALISRVPGGGRPVVDWLLAHPDPERLARLQERVGDKWNKEWLRANVDPDLRLLVALHPIEDNQVASFFGRRGDAPSWKSEWTRPALALARDSALPLGLRLLALDGLRNEPELTEDVLPIGRAILADPSWHSEYVEEVYLLRQVLEHAVGGVQNVLLTDIVRDAAWPEKWAAYLVYQAFDPRASGAAEAASAVLARGFDRPEWDDAMRKIFESMAQVPTLADPEVLARAAQHPRYARGALYAIGFLRDPRYLPLLAGIVDSPSDKVQLASAAEALFGFLDIEAVEPLLAAAAKVQDPELRDRCLAHLEKIREYQEARDRWAARAAGARTREKVIAELVGQLDSSSEETRIQAIRALATWQALEAMPRLIELGSSGSKAVAAAARAALDRLNESKD